jgi:triosephosphate isomerase
VPFVLEQLRAGLFDVRREFLPRIVIAYEPIWAIGTGEVATPEDAQQVCKAIRYFVADISDDAVADQTRVISGGSVKARNIASLIAQDDIDGGLVGGASIDPEEFATICRYREHVTG